MTGLVFGGLAGIFLPEIEPVERIREKKARCRHGRRAAVAAQ